MERERAIKFHRRSPACARRGIIEHRRRWEKRRQGAVFAFHSGRRFASAHWGVNEIKRFHEPIYRRNGAKMQVGRRKLRFFEKSA
ncbi:MAG: hypothetical protein PUK79_11775 [Clostridiales bacterium]|nr:hypothetical protein [Clostridiales bacterium]MDY2834322.1 hypothetical protein [Candidatus Aphodomonas sp.]